jgi:hypothetical protein
VSEDEPAAGPATGLSDLELSILAIERQPWASPGSRANAICSLAVTPTRYAQVLNRMLDDQRVLRADPLLVNRLRRIRDQRTRNAPRWARESAS